VGRKSVRKALELLASEGLLHRIERGGTFVQPQAMGGVAGGEPREVLDCINVIQARATVGEALRFIVQDHITGYTQALDRHHIKTRFLPLLNEEDKEFGSLMWDRVPLSRQGCVVVNLRNRALMEWLNEHGVPFVVQCYFHYDASVLPPHHRVFINKTGGSYLATRHLIDLGHRRIGHVGARPGYPHPNPNWEGYQAAMQCAGLDIPEQDLVHVVTDDPMEALGPVTEFLRRPDRPTAVVVRNDVTAMVTVQVAKSLGIKVPQDLSVIGMNDQPEAETTDPPLTTVAIPRQELGRCAMEMLLAVAEGSFGEFQSRALDCRLVVRNTTAPPARPDRGERT